jgi:glucan 1,3-beta-glucosidase
MNMVRIPIGYWAFDNGGSPYVTGAADYLDKAISWARTANLKVIIDLHGAPGSQNGFDNSGQRLDITAITWLQGGISGPTAQQAIGVLTQIAGKYAQASYRDVVIGIELLNEPAGWYLNNADLRAFYQSGYEVVRKVSPDTAVVLQDAFLQPSSYNGFLTPSSNAYNVVLGKSLESPLRDKHMLIDH